MEDSYSEEKGEDRGRSCRGPRAIEIQSTSPKVGTYYAFGNNRGATKRVSATDLSQVLTVLYSISALTTVLLRPNIQLDVIGIR